jgi:hypothetical protein
MQGNRLGDPCLLSKVVMVHLAQDLCRHLGRGIDGYPGLFHLYDRIDHEFLAGHTTDHWLAPVVQILHDIKKTAQHLTLQDHKEAVDILPSLPSSISLFT